MPEMLVLYSFFMFSQSWTISVAALGVGVLARLSAFLLQYGKDENSLDKSKS
jgi:hypothetical protein